MMKRFLCLVSFLIMVISAVFSSENTAFTVTMLIEDGLKKNQQEIMKLSPELTGMEKMLIYNDNQKKPIWPFIGNLFLGAGIGSFLQGDTTGGLIGLGGEVLGVGLIFFAGISSENGNYGVVDALSFSGLGLMLATRIFELTRPFHYSKQYNSVLRNSLTFSNMSFELLAVPYDNKVSYGGMLTIKL